MEKDLFYQLEKPEQPMWLDGIRYNSMAESELRRVIENDEIVGGSQAGIFEKEMTCDDDCNNSSLITLDGMNAETINEVLTKHTMRMAADDFGSLYEKTNGRDGYISVDVNPHLAYHTEGMMDDARRLWSTIQRPNVFITVPATNEGIPVIKQLVGEGINVKVTLLYGLSRYQEVVEAYIAGIETRLLSGQPIDCIASVASCFMSCIDSMVDPLLDTIINQGGTRATLAKQIRGKVADASARLSYQFNKKIFATKRFRKMVRWGACPQRILWPETGSRNYEYSDPKSLPEYNPGNDDSILERLSELNINIDAVTWWFEENSIQNTIKLFDKMTHQFAKTAGSIRVCH